MKDKIMEILDDNSLLDGELYAKETITERISTLIQEERRDAVEGLLEVNYHYWRECPNCGYAGNNYIHCMHDRVQSRCIKCDKELPTIEGDCDCEFVITRTDVEEYLKEGK